MHEGEFAELNEASPKVFEFSGYCYVAIFSVVVWAVYYISQTPGFTSEDMIEIGLRMAAAAILPGVLAFAGWLLFGRTNWATNIIWFLGFAILGGHACSVTKSKGRELNKQAALAALPAPRSGAEIMAAAIKGGSVAGMSVWRKPPQTLNAPEALQKAASLDAATRQHLQKASAAAKQFAAAFQGLSLGRSIAARRYGSVAQLERQIFTTQLQLGLLKTFPETLEDARQEYRGQIAGIGLSQIEQETVMEGYHAGADEVAPRLLEFHQRITAHGKATMEALTLLADNFGAWTRELESQEIVFESEDAQSAYDEIMAELERAEPELRALRKRLTN